MRGDREACKPSATGLSLEARPAGGGGELGVAKRSQPNLLLMDLTTD